MTSNLLATLTLAETELRTFLPQLERLFLEGWRTDAHTIHDKSRQNAFDFATEYDFKIERRFGEWVKKTFPAHTVIGEELSSAPTDSQIPEWLWAIDPIDGTTNYLSKSPDCSIVISLRYQGTPVLAICDEPAKQKLYCAIHQKGFTCNGELITASAHGQQPLNQSLAAVTYLNQPHRMMTAVGKLWDEVGGILIKMSSVMESCQVASGEIGVGAFYLLGPHEWPAVYLFAVESGCSIGEIGAPDQQMNLEKIDTKSFILARNSVLFDQVKNLVKPVPALT